MSDLESDYENYETAKELEGGLHSGRQNPSRGLMLTTFGVLAVLTLGLLAIWLLIK